MKKCIVPRCDEDRICNVCHGCQLHHGEEIRNLNEHYAEKRLEERRNRSINNKNDWEEYKNGENIIMRRTSKRK